MGRQTNKNETLPFRTTLLTSSLLNTICVPPDREQNSSLKKDSEDAVQTRVLRSLPTFTTFAVSRSFKDMDHANSSEFMHDAMRKRRARRRWRWMTFYPPSNRMPQP